MRDDHSSSRSFFTFAGIHFNSVAVYYKAGIMIRASATSRLEPVSVSTEI